MIIFGLAVGLILAGVIIAYLSSGMGRAGNIFWWVGAILAVVGVILLITPVLVWIDHQLRSMM